MGIFCSACYHECLPHESIIPDTMTKEELYRDNCILSKKLLICRLKLGEISLSDIGEACLK